MNERHGPLLMLPTARRDAVRSQITLGRLVYFAYIQLRGCNYSLSII